MVSDWRIKLILRKLTLVGVKITNLIKKVSVLDRLKKPLIKHTFSQTIISLLLVTVQNIPLPNQGILFNGKDISGKDLFQL